VVLRAAAAINTLRFFSEVRTTKYVPHKDPYAERTYPTSLAQDNGVEPAMRNAIAMEKSVDFALSKPPATDNNATARPSDEVRTTRISYVPHTGSLDSRIKTRLWHRQSFCRCQVLTALANHYLHIIYVSAAFAGLLKVSCS
jgi:hypothetical protein